jgi:hypothetical protein
MLPARVLRSSRSRLSAACFILALALPFAALAAPDDDSFYSPVFGVGTLEGQVANASTYANVVAVDSDYVYFGGSFAKVCGYRVNNIVRYRKKTGGFERLGTANACGTNGQVLVIKPIAGGVHVGGIFSRVGVDSAQAGGKETGPYAYYDGKDWSPVGPKLAFANSVAGARVSAIAFDGSDTYIGGAFTLAGTDTINNVARYKGGDKMEPLYDQGHLVDGVAGTYNTFQGFKFTGIRVTQSSVIVGGNFSRAGGVNVTRVAQWNKNLEKWDNMKGGLDQAPAGTISDMDQDENGKVYFAHKQVHRWDDTGWTTLPGMETISSVSNFIWNTPFGSMIRGAGGSVFDSGSIAFYDGNAWKSLPLYRLGFTQTSEMGFAADKSKLWIGSGGGVQGGNGMAYWDGKQFGALGNGLRVTRQGGLGFNDFVEFEGKIIAAGSFSHLGSVAVEGVARWTGTAWEAMGDGYQSVWRLAVFKGKLYACGSLQKQGQPVSGSLARWTGTAWEIVPGFEKNQVEAMAATTDYLYLGGAGLGTTSAPLARWDGEKLEEFGKELTSSAQIGIHSIVPRKPGNVCVAGYFNKVGGVATGGVACYDGTAKTWTPMGAALPSGSNTTSLVAIGDDLYLGIYGAFANGAKNIGKWDGSAWAPVGGGLDKGVQRMMANGSDLYVVGVFTKAGDVVVNGVARWDGKDWTALGSGVSPVSANSLYIGPGGLWLGGGFTVAGGVPSRNVALYGNVEKKTDIPMGIVAHGMRGAAKALPGMRVRLPAVEFGAEGAYRKADGRFIPGP